MYILSSLQDLHFSLKEQVSQPSPQWKQLPSSIFMFSSLQRLQLFPSAHERQSVPHERQASWRGSKYMSSLRQVKHLLLRSHVLQFLPHSKQIPSPRKKWSLHLVHGFPGSNSRQASPLDTHLPL